MPDSVRSELSKQIDNIKNDTLTIADKFKLQLQQLINQHRNIEGSQAIQERICKGSTYFIDKLQNLGIALEGLPTQTDNKQVRQLWSENYRSLRTDLRVKLTCLHKIKSGFDVAGYLNTRAKALLDEPKTERKARSRSTAAVNAEHAELYAELRSWRHEKTIELDVDEYLVLQQKTLLELVEKLPATYAELKEIKGLGKKKLQQLGADLLEIIRSYRFRNDMPLPDIEVSFDFDEKKKKEKVDTKRVSFELFKQGWSVEDIASERGLTIGTIETHLAHFVEAGELDIHELIPDDKIALISSYITENEVSSITQIKQALSDGITWNEIRVVTKWVVKNNS
ncbi:MAG: helix-turn-helix domain-containing protein [Prevotellaceae bacterium]|nr:helix-turn-helix domain-containing protein [Prevotellaceae bacterium]